MTVGELLRRVSSRELSEWMLYYEREPFGEERADTRAALISSTVANTARNPKKKRKPFKIKDFLLEFGKRKAQGWQEQLQIVEMFNRAMGGKDLRKKE